MKIPGVMAYTPSFTSREKKRESIAQQYGKTDSIIQEKMRENLEMPITDEVKYGGRLPEYHFNKMLGVLFSKPQDVSNEKMGEINAYNVRRFGENCYSGSTLVDSPEEIPKLKKAGIQRVIDFVGYYRYGEECKKNGLEYHSFFTDERIWNNAACNNKENFLDESQSYYDRWGKSDDEIKELLECDSQDYDEEKNRFIEELVQFVNMVNKGHVYMGCQFGTDKTDDALCLNSVFNPKFKDEGFHRTSIPNDVITNKIKNFYSNLTDDHKKRLGWTKEHEEYVLEMLD